MLEKRSLSFFLSVFQSWYSGHYIFYSNLNFIRRTHKINKNIKKKKKTNNIQCTDFSNTNSYLLHLLYEILRDSLSLAASVRLSMPLQTARAEEQIRHN